MIKKIFKVFVILFPFLLLISILILRSNSLNIYHTTESLEVINDMDNQKKLKTQGFFCFNGDTNFFSNAKINSKPNNIGIYRFTPPEFDSAIKKYTNPLIIDDYSFQRGKNLFEIFCVPCHNTDGKGRGLVITKVKLAKDEEGFPAPADLTRKETKAMSDARLFHILSAGQNLMFPVFFKMDENERWCVVNYIRYLQSLN